MTIGVVPVGYADGLNRQLSNHIEKVIINNELCYIIAKLVWAPLVSI